MEMRNKKSRSSLNDTMPPPAVPAERDPMNKIKTYNLFKLATPHSVFTAFGEYEFANAILNHILIFNEHFAERPDSQVPSIVELEIDSNDALAALSPRDASLLQHLNYLQRIYNEVDDVKHLRNDAPVVRRIFIMSTEFITFLYHYAIQLDYGRHKTYDVTVECKQLAQSIRNGTAFNRGSSRLCCLDDKPCIDGEKLIFERRLLAVLSLICTECYSLTASLLDSAVGMNKADVDMEDDSSHESFVDLLAIALTNIGFSVFDRPEMQFIQFEPELKKFLYDFSQIENIASAQGICGGIVTAADRIGKQLHAN